MSKQKTILLIIFSFFLLKNVLAVDLKSNASDKFYSSINEFSQNLAQGLADKLKQNENTIKKLLQIEKSNNNIIIINGEILFTSENYNKLLEKIDKFFKNNSSLNIKDFKEITNTSRKYAVPLLEYLDKQKVTYRLGNERKYNKK